MIEDTPSQVNFESENVGSKVMGGVFLQCADKFGGLGEHVSSDQSEAFWVGVCWFAGLLLVLFIFLLLLFSLLLLFLSLLLCLPLFFGKSSVFVFFGGVKRFVENSEVGLNCGLSSILENSVDN